MLANPRNRNYATKLTLIGVFLSLFTVFASRFSRDRPVREDFVFKPYDLLVMALAVLRLGRLAAYDKIFEPIRYPVAETVPDETGAGESVRPRGAGIRQAFGQLFSCPICAGTWIAAALVYAKALFPTPTKIFTSIMATMGLAEILNAVVEALSWTGQAARKEAGGKDHS